MAHGADRLLQGQDRKRWSALIVYFKTRKITVAWKKTLKKRDRDPFCHLLLRSRTTPPTAARGLLRPSPRAPSSARRRSLLHPPPPRAASSAAAARVVLRRSPRAPSSFLRQPARPPVVLRAPDLPSRAGSSARRRARVPPPDAVRSSTRPRRAASSAPLVRASSSAAAGARTSAVPRASPVPPIRANPCRHAVCTPPAPIHAPPLRRPRRRRSTLVPPRRSVPGVGVVTAPSRRCSCPTSRNCFIPGVASAPPDHHCRHATAPLLPGLHCEYLGLLDDRIKYGHNGDEQEHLKHCQYEAPHPRWPRTPPPS
ncbi:uncharacterized protein DKFZp434B061-like [Panicum virgatum]|uniref:uncharacterized protein DKFZp434B061-like n=1 Tax=Panicum virgatum TaxID=38727 RepID=UPI0019D578C3|nr:uncharacterized protein DKFZp434B061-like [Panicum virgatum]